MEDSLWTRKVKHRLQQKIQKLKFVDSNEILRSVKCVKCQKIALFNLTMDCKHLACNKCFQLLQLRSCPVRDCKNKEITACFIDKSVENILKNLRVYCEFREYGCSELLPLSNILDHSDGCPFSSQKTKEQAELYKLHDRIQRLEEKVKEVHEKVEKLLTAIRNQDIIFKQRVEDVILDAVKKASAMQQLHLEHKLLFKMSELLDNKMRVHENRSENDLKSKCETHFLHLNAKLEDRLQERVELIKNVVNCKIVSQLKVEVKQLRSDLKNDQQMEFQRKMTKVMETCDKNKSDLKSQLEEDFKKVQDALLDHVKIEMKGLNDIIKNVESKLKINKRIFNDMRSEMSDVINNGLESRESKSDNCLDNDVVKEQPVIKQQLLKLREDVNSLLNNRNQFDERHFQPQSLTLNWEPQHTPQSSCYFSDVYHLFEFGCSLRFKCHVNSSYFQIEYLRRENDVSFPLNGYHAFTFIVGEQGNHQTLKRCCEPFFDDSEFPPFEPFFTSWGSSFFQNSIENGKALVKIIVEPLTHLIMREPRQYGTLMWKIDKLKATREKHLIGSEYLWSQSFYSSDKGYRMKVLLGLGHDVHALLCFLKGPWDKDLLKSSEHLITIRIINQNDPSGQLDVLTEKTCKCLNMCLLSILQKDNDVEKCVKDDTLVIHLKVQPCL